MGLKINIYDFLIFPYVFPLVTQTTRPAQLRKHFMTWFNSFMTSFVPKTKILRVRADNYYYKDFIYLCSKIAVNPQFMRFFRLCTLAIMEAGLTMANWHFWQRNFFSVSHLNWSKLVKINEIHKILSKIGKLAKY